MPFVCPYPECGGKDFPTSRRLQNHMNVHTGARPHVCDYPGCGKGFKQQQHLDQHFRAKHTNDRPYECDYPGCDKAFATSTDLARHKRKHTGERPHKCDYPGCGKAFRLRHSWIAHKRVHTGERPFVCRKKCTKAFTQTSNRMKHEKICGTVSNYEPKVEPQILAFLLKSVEWSLLKGLFEFFMKQRCYDIVDDIEIYMGGPKFKKTIMLPDNTQYRPDLMVACPGWGTLWLEIDELHHHPSVYDPVAEFTRMRRTWLEFLLPRGLGPVHILRYRTTNGAALEPERGLKFLRANLQFLIGLMHRRINTPSEDLHIYYLNTPRGVQEPPNVKEAMQHDSETFAFKNRRVKCRVWW